MPFNKSSFGRCLIILRECKFEPITKDRLADKIQEETGCAVSPSSIEKDISYLRHDSSVAIFAPIKANKHGYYIDSNWSLSDTIKKNWRL